MPSTTVDPRRGRSRPHGAPLPAAVAACHACDLLQRVPPLAPGARARCARCKAVLASHSRDPLDLPLALVVTALVVLVVANFAPLMELSAVGRHASTTIISGARRMWEEGERITAALVAFCAVLAPTFHLLFMLVVLIASRRPVVPEWVGEALRVAETMKAWAMLEVMLIGILVALIKIAELAEVRPGIGMFAVGALVVLFPAIAVTFDADDVWERVRWRHARSPAPPGKQGA
jgi:paraquat-inducible protein A